MAYAVIGALMILGILVAMSRFFGNRESTIKIYALYAWSIILPVSTVIGIYFAMIGALSWYETLFMLFCLLLIALWTDWSLF